MAYRGTSPQPAQSRGRSPQPPYSQQGYQRADQRAAAAGALNAVYGQPQQALYGQQQLAPVQQFQGGSTSFAPGSQTPLQNGRVALSAVPVPVQSHRDSQAATPYAMTPAEGRQPYFNADDMLRPRSHAMTPAVAMTPQVSATPIDGRQPYFNIEDPLKRRAMQASSVAGGSVQFVTGMSTTSSTVQFPVKGQEIPQQQNGQGDGDFLRLLDSLEVRVDLMAQMQQTRDQIQARARTMEDSTPKASGQMVDVYGAPVDNSPMRATMPIPIQYQGLCQDQAQGSTSDVERLSSENAELWSHVGELRDEIARLRIDNQNMEQQLRGLGLSPRGGAEELREQLQALLNKVKANDAEGHKLKEELADARIERERMKRGWETERQQLLEELEVLRMRPTRKPSASPVRGRERSMSIGPLDQSRVLDHSRGGALSSGYSAGLATAPVLPAQTAAAIPSADCVVQPFSRQTCGVNVALSEDGYVATRMRGCRQSVLVGSAPLVPQLGGWYFELEIKETVEGWVGGLGLGITRTRPDDLKRVPDKAWRMPHTFVVGYWGCVFIDGKERRTKWRVDTLPVGTKLGLLVSEGTGDLRVFAAGELMVLAEGALAEHVFPGVELFPVVDVFAATLAVSLSPRASPPPKPWGPDSKAALSPPGSPGDSVVSMSRSLLSAA